MKAKDGKCIVAMPSMTAAMRGERLLGAGGMFARVIGLPQGRTKKGCAYGLELPCSFAAEAVKKLDKAGLPHGELLGTKQM